MFHRYVRIVLIEMEHKLIVMCFEHIYHELRTIYSMAIFKGSGEKNIAILGISRISRFRENKIYEMTAKKFFDQPDLLVIEGFATLLENGQVLLSNSKIFNFTVTCLRHHPGSFEYCRKC